MRAIFPGLVILLVAGCFGGTATRPNLASYDLSSPTPGQSPGQPDILRHVEVLSPAWLDATAMQYRLAYADRSRRDAYAESRWVAPPARMLEQQLRQRLLRGGANMRDKAAGCHLRIELDEFLQVFEAPGRSHVVLAAHAVLLAPFAEASLLRQSFRVSRAAGENARSGAVALDAAGLAFGEEVAQWLGHLGRETSKRCRLG